MTFPPLPHWWQHRAVRVTAALLTLALLLAPWFVYQPQERWRVLGESVDPHHLPLFVGLLLLPFMRAVSYRKRDLLIIALVPLYGELVAAVLVSRLLALPRRDWTPRPDELPRVVRGPGGRGAYVLRPTFAAAEELRTEWCRNPRHEHPYADGPGARRIGCQDRVDRTPATV